MNRKYIYFILVITITTTLFFAEKYVDRENEHYPNTSEVKKDVGPIEFDETFYPTSTTGVVINHAYYSLSYAEEHEQAEWVAYEMKKSHLSQNEFKRPYFVEDKEVRTSSADWRNYKKSGYDRGHLCPAGDRRFNYGAFHETFLTSNISPQNSKFNSGVWNRLEQKVRFWAKKYDGVFVITGGVLKKGLSGIGDERVSVPEEFYKIVVDASGDKLKTIAFLIPNKGTNTSFYDFAVNIDQIEAKTGIDFFPALSNSEEKILESKIDLKAWGKR
ncbi:MAG: DNA/RNA non-specific endonuclease [Flavobacteriaceae bacterium]|nr:DNA/RNA non-specific endonuclease [Flavobacteriaceae bacterium]